MGTAGGPRAWARRCAKEAGQGVLSLTEMEKTQSFLFRQCGAPPGVPGPCFGGGDGGPRTDSPGRSDPPGGRRFQEAAYGKARGDGYAGPVDGRDSPKKE